jgi:large subunit ribosomal protein L10
MNKEAKKNYIEEMKKIFSSNEAVMITHYQGLNVTELDELRKELRENSILFKITKNRITKLAVKDSPCKDLEKFFTGPTAAAISSDPFMSARILSKFAKKNDNLRIVAGFMEGKVIDKAEVVKIASLPTLKEARANLVGILTASAQKIVGILLAQSKKMAILAPTEEIKK